MRAGIGGGGGGGAAPFRGSIGRHTSAANAVARGEGENIDKYMYMLIDVYSNEGGESCGDGCERALKVYLWQVGAAAVGGGALLFVTGGLAAPALAAALAAAGVGSAATITLASSAVSEAVLLYSSMPV